MKRLKNKPFEKLSLMNTYIFLNDDNKQLNVKFYYKTNKPWGRGYIINLQNKWFRISKEEYEKINKDDDFYFQFFKKIFFEIGYWISKKEEIF